MKKILAIILITSGIHVIKTAESDLHNFFSSENPESSIVQGLPEYAQKEYKALYNKRAKELENAKLKLDKANENHALAILNFNISHPNPGVSPVPNCISNLKKELQNALKHHSQIERDFQFIPTKPIKLATDFADDFYAKMSC